MFSADSRSRKRLSVYFTLLSRDLNWAHLVFEETRRRAADHCESKTFATYRDAATPTVWQWLMRLGRPRTSHAPQCTLQFPPPRFVAEGCAARCAPRDHQKPRRASPFSGGGGGTNERVTYARNLSAA